MKAAAVVLAGVFAAAGQWWATAILGAFAVVMAVLERPLFDDPVSDDPTAPSPALVREIERIYAEMEARGDR